MSDTSKKPANGAVEQIVRNMTSDIHNTDGQYRQLGFHPPTPPTDTWNMPNHLQQNSYISPYTMCTPETQMSFQTIGNQCPQPIPFNYNNQNPIFSEQYDKNTSGNDFYTSFNIYQNNQQNPNVPDIGVFTPEFKYNMSFHNINTESAFLQNHQDLNSILNNNSPVHNQFPNHIDNLLGNWTPNTNGTYSPFGNVSSTNMANIFVNHGDIDCLNNINHQELNQNTREYLDRTNEDVHNFQFHRDIKKPRMVAEVKPMRPSYSDVLLKSVPQTNKSGKSEFKDMKQRKETKKNIKNDKTQKMNGLLSRSNTNNEIKDLPSDKTNQFTKSSEKTMKDCKTSQLTRKWVSLDNLSESFSDIKTENNDSRKTRKTDEVNFNKNVTKINNRKSSKNNVDSVDTDSGSGKNDTLNSSKSSVKKGNKVGSRQKYDSIGNSDRPLGKRNLRTRKRESHVPLGVIRQKLKLYVKGWWKFLIGFILWLFHLVSDVCSLSVHLMRDGIINLWTWIVVNWAFFADTSISVLKKICFYNWIHEKFKKNKDKEEKKNFTPTGLQNNINMPMTGEEAMKRLLACKGKDPYSILGVTPTCTDDDIKRYYKKQAVLVHPDKNKQPGAEEAFKILVHAFDMISEPERRATYNKGVAESAQVVEAWTELTELLAQFQQKVEAAAKTIRCSACGSGHKRIKIDRPSYAARNCGTCKIHHSAREGDIWAEAKCFGFLWHYYACMEGGVYDITEWAGCQKNSLKQLKPDSHNVQYRIALGKQSGSTRRHSSSARADGANLENLLNRFYGQNESSQSTRRRHKKSNK